MNYVLMCRGELVKRVCDGKVVYTNPRFSPERIAELEKMWGKVRYESTGTK